MTATDPQGLNSISATMDGYTVTRELGGQIEATLPEQILRAGDDGPITSGSVNEVTFRAVDAADTIAIDHDETYIRKYDKMEDTRLDISARYIPFAADALGRCLDDVETEPSIGNYGTGTDDPIPAEVTSKHIDQMTSHGITRTTLVFNGKDRNFGYVEELLDSGLLDQIRVEPSYSVLSFWNNEDRHWRDDVLPEHLNFLRETLMSRENAARYKGRPTLHTWNIINLANVDSYREKIADEFGGFEQFVGDIRDHLRIDGRDPFLIAGTASVDNYLYRNEAVNELVTQFDAVCPWIAADLDPEEQTDWDDAMADTRKVFDEQAGFASRNGMEFVPTVYPGFNDKRNTCHIPPGRHLPRSKERFREVLELADEFRSTEMINIATWNDWVEGTQIEPGTLRGEYCDTAYLERVKAFQSPNS